MASEQHYDPYFSLKTYTAGEDGSRLAEMAKEFGLQNQRQPRKQVRPETTPTHPHVVVEPATVTARQRVTNIIQDHSIEVARMRAVYSRQRHDHRTTDLHLEDVGVLDMTTTGGPPQQWDSDAPDWLERIEQEEEDLHAHGVGGDLTSAVLGVIKGCVPHFRKRRTSFD
jgi:hypothetical protein